MVGSTTARAVNASHTSHSPRRGRSSGSISSIIDRTTARWSPVVSTARIRSSIRATTNRRANPEEFGLGGEEMAQRTHGQAGLARHVPHRCLLQPVPHHDPPDPLRRAGSVGSAHPPASAPLFITQSCYLLAANTTVLDKRERLCHVEKSAWLTAAVVGWIALNGAVLLLAPGDAPFDWPAAARPALRARPGDRRSGHPRRAGTARRHPHTRSPVADPHR